MFLLMNGIKSGANDLILIGKASEYTSLHRSFSHLANQPSLLRKINLSQYVNDLSESVNWLFRL